MKKKNVFLTYWKSIIIVVGILYLSFAPPSTFKALPVFKHADKIVHFCMFFALTVVLIYDYSRTYKSIFKGASFYLICFVAPIVLGGVIEIMQGAFFYPRTASWFDWLADIVGVLLGAGLMYLISSVLRKSS